MYCIDSVYYFELFLIFTGPELLSRTWTYLEGQQRSMQHKNCFLGYPRPGMVLMGVMWEGSMKFNLKTKPIESNGTLPVYENLREWLQFVVNVGRKDTNPMDPIGGLGFYFQFRFFRIFITGFALLSGFRWILLGF